LTSQKTWQRLNIPNLAHGITGTPALAESHSPLADTFWGELFGMLTDKFGNHWLLSYHS
jgi:hypothetical protein